MISVDTEQLELVISKLSVLADEAEELLIRFKNITSEMSEDDELKLLRQWEVIEESAKNASNELNVVCEKFQVLDTAMLHTAESYKEIETKNCNAIKRMTTVIGNIKTNIDSVMTADILPKSLTEENAENYAEIEELINSAHNEMQAVNIMAVKEHISEEYEIKEIKTE